MKYYDFTFRTTTDIEQLDPDQAKLFKWRSALRILPFLGSSGHFDFWRGGQIEEYLYSLFYTFDATFDAPHSIPRYTILEAEKAAVSFMECREDHLEDGHPIAAAAMSGSNYNYFCHAANLAEAVIAAVAQLADCIYEDNDETYAFVEAVGTATKKAGLDNLRATIFQDLLDIKKGIITPIDISSYGEVWPNFKDALRKEGCQYWITWYENLVKDGYIKDKEQLKKRINIPPVINGHGARWIADYLEDIETTGLRSNDSQLVILGEKGVGKTSIARKLKNPKVSITTPQESTEAVAVSSWNLDKKLAVQIWDFAGDTLSDAIHQFFQMERCLYLLVCDSRIKKLDRMRYWLDLIKDYGAVSKVIILVNERENKQLQLPLAALKKEYPIIAIYSLDIANDEAKWAQVKPTIIAQLKNNPDWKNQLVPNKYYAIKRDLQQQLDEQNKPYFTWKEYETIAKKHVSHDTWILSRILEYYGINLWREKIGNTTFFFNPQWIAQGLYSILNWVKKEAKTSITLAQLSTIFANNRDRYPAADDKVLFELMQRFELAYKNPKEECLELPYLYDWDDEEVLKVFDFHPKKDLVAQFEADKNFPPNVISRFITQHSHQMPGRVWRHGVLLKIDNAFALVIQTGATITIYLEGEKKIDLLVELRATFFKIFKDYSIPTPELYYRVYPETDYYPSLFLAENNICALFLAEKTYFFEPIQQAIPMAPIVLKYGIVDDTIFSGYPQERRKNGIVSTAKLVTQMREELKMQKESYERSIEQQQGFLEDAQRENRKLRDANEQLRLLTEKPKKKKRRN